MKRFSAMVVVLGMVAILAGLALAAEKEKTPDATLTLSEGFTCLRTHHAVRATHGAGGGANDRPPSLAPRGIT